MAPCMGKTKPRYLMRRHAAFWNSNAYSLVFSSIGESESEDDRYPVSGGEA